MNSGFVFIRYGKYIDMEMTVMKEVFIVSSRNRRHDMPCRGPQNVGQDEERVWRKM